MLTIGFVMLLFDTDTIVIYFLLLLMVGGSYNFSKYFNKKIMILFRILKIIAIIWTFIYILFIFIIFSDICYVEFKN